jgi:hypothetical protein
VLDEPERSTTELDGPTPEARQLDECGDGIRRLRGWPINDVPEAGFGDASSGSKSVDRRDHVLEVVRVTA